jgi:hypothetical protein
MSIPIITLSPPSGVGAVPQLTIESIETHPIRATKPFVVKLLFLYKDYTGSANDAYHEVSKSFAVNLYELTETGAYDWVDYIGPELPYGKTLPVPYRLWHHKQPVVVTQFQKSVMPKKWEGWECFRIERSLTLAKAGTYQLHFEIKFGGTTVSFKTAPIDCGKSMIELLGSDV